MTEASVEITEEAPEQPVELSPDQIKYFKDHESVMLDLPELGQVAMDKDLYLKNSNGKTFEEQVKVAQDRLREMPVNGIKILIGRVKDYRNADDAHYEDGTAVSLFKGGDKIFPKYIVTSTIGEDGKRENFVNSNPNGTYQTAKDVGEEPGQFNRKTFLVPLYVPIDRKAPAGMIQVLPPHIKV